MKFMSVFESLTHAKLKDCIQQPERLVFVVQQGEMGKALGRNGSNIRRLESLIKKNIKIVEFSEDIKQFITSYIYPIRVQRIDEQDSIITITGSDTRTKGLLIGRDAKNLSALKDAVSRFFSHIQDIKVV